MLLAEGQDLYSVDLTPLRFGRRRAEHATVDLRNLEAIHFPIIRAYDRGPLPESVTMEIRTRRKVASVMVSELRRIASENRVLWGDEDLEAYTLLRVLDDVCQSDNPLVEALKHLRCAISITVDREKQDFHKIFAAGVSQAKTDVLCPVFRLDLAPETFVSKDH